MTRRHVLLGAALWPLALFIYIFVDTVQSNDWSERYAQSYIPW